VSRSAAPSHTFVLWAPGRPSETRFVQTSMNSSNSTNWTVKNLHGRCSQPSVVCTGFWPSTYPHTTSPAIVNSLRNLVRQPCLAGRRGQGKDGVEPRAGTAAVCEDFDESDGCCKTLIAQLSLDVLHRGRVAEVVCVFEPKHLPGLAGRVINAPTPRSDDRGVGEGLNGSGKSASGHYNISVKCYDAVPCRGLWRTARTSILPRRRGLRNDP
jgi:hypothetical protein